MEKEAVGIRELRRGLSRFVKRAEEGETVQISHHGRSVAQLVPLPTENDPGVRLEEQRGEDVTISVPDHVYQQARIKAAAEGRSVSALVVELLTSLMTRDDEFNQLLAQQEQVLEEIESFRASDRLDRDRIHERGIR